MTGLGHTNIIDAVVDLWRSQNVDLRPGADDDKLKFFEMKCGTKLPESFLYLYSLTNGMASAMDDRMFTLWSFEEILQNNGILKSSKATVIFFGDFLIDSHRYYLLLDQEHESIVADDYDEVVAENFEEFGQFLLTDPAKLRLWT